ncbi:hypothetical protein [Dyadobacter sandarakinus]|uniref:Uncharacterized protein n=1 Tax=Dyadobacter sandarakinus TaxID=2747268 RepID=A0ABX7I0B9_9BACT|nr:hypothetical protein [Dyadobacter sandarakinus]QRQ99448.1 hypothetical protein HWI92_00245 [Dyadobacter sandarakinus]
MNKSNIFVYAELSKFVESLTSDMQLCKKHLRDQSSYFSVIPSKYFSQELNPEWESICKLVSQKGPGTNEDGKIVRNAIMNTIDQMSTQECLGVTRRILLLHEKVRNEIFE